MFQGMTLGEQRTLMALAVVIALGLGVQAWRDHQQQSAPLVLHHADGTLAIPASFALPTPMVAVTMPAPATPAVAVAVPPMAATPAALPAGVAPTPAAAASGTVAAKIDLNRATLADLDGLPGIGPVRSKAILEYRTRAGGFRAVNDLLAVDGIGEKTLEKLKPLVSVNGQ